MLAKVLVVTLSKVLVYTTATGPILIGHQFWVCLRCVFYGQEKNKHQEKMDAQKEVDTNRLHAIGFIFHRSPLSASSCGGGGGKKKPQDKLTAQSVCFLWLATFCGCHKSAQHNSTFLVVSNWQADNWIPTLELNLQESAASLKFNSISYTMCETRKHEHIVLKLRPFCTPLENLSLEEILLIFASKTLNVPPTFAF